MAKRLRVGFNALAWLPGFSGGDGSYIQGLSRALSRMDGLELVVFAASWNQAFFAGLGPVVKPLICPLSNTSFVRRALWEQVMLPAWIRRQGLDLFHATVNVSPLRCSVPSVLTIHDVTPFAAPRLVPLPLRLYWQVLRRESVRRAACVIAFSTAGRAEIQKWLNVPDSKLDVIRMGIHPTFTPQGQAETPGYPYWLWVGRPYPTKNVPQLLRVFRRLGEENPAWPYHLHLVGPAGWDDPTIRQTCISDAWLAVRVHRLPYLPPEQLARQYRGATLLVYPSTDESFALPVLEAMACGTPVVCSNAGAMPEVTGGAAEVFQVGYDSALQGALCRLLRDEGHWERLRTLGLENASEFSWGRSAKETARIYQRALDNADLRS